MPYGKLYEELSAINRKKDTAYGREKIKRHAKGISGHKSEKKVMVHNFISPLNTPPATPPLSIMESECSSKP
jgi:hypothetical protein